MRSTNRDFKNNHELYSCSIFILVTGELVLLAAISGSIDIFSTDSVALVNRAEQEVEILGVNWFCYKCTKVCKHTKLQNRFFLL